PMEAARKEIARCAGSQFDPRVVDKFLEIPVQELQTVIERVESPTETDTRDLLSSTGTTTTSKLQ
ncbi:MAG: hypothetical protein ACE10D_01455, partial [Planctomycetota bacterium]